MGFELIEQLFLASKARGESTASQLPGRQNGGAADAYRHLLWSGELARTFGTTVAYMILMHHEREPDGGADNGLDMWNNAIGVKIGEHVRKSGGNWEDVVRLSREVMHRSLEQGQDYDQVGSWQVREADEGIKFAYDHFHPVRPMHPGDLGEQTSKFHDFADEFVRDYSFRSEGKNITLDGGALIVNSIAMTSPKHWRVHPKVDVDGEEIELHVAESQFPTQHWFAGEGFVYEDGNSAPVTKIAPSMLSKSREMSPARGAGRLDSQDVGDILEKLYDGDLETNNWFLRMSAQQPRSILDPFAESGPTDLQDDVLPVPATEISGARVENIDRPGSDHRQNLDELAKPAVFRRSFHVSDPTPQNEPFSGLVSNEIVEALPGVGDALERRSKVHSAQLENRTNNEQSPAAPPTPRPRPKLNPITEGFLKDMPDDGRLVLVAEMAGLKGRKDTDKAEAERLARFDVQRKKAQDLEDIKAGKLSTVWDQYGHPKAVRDLLGEEDYQSFVDDRLEAGLIFHATAGLHLLQDKDLFGIAESTIQIEAPHEKLAELMTPKVMGAAAERAREILALRKKKPSEAVLLSTELAKRKEAFDAAFEANEPVDTEEMDRFLFYFEAAQKEIGVAEPAIELIPHNWASQVAERFQMPDTSNGTPTNRREREAALKQQYTDMQNTFGRRTDDVVAYSLARSASNGV